MPRVKILPHPVICSEGAGFELRSGENFLEAALDHGIPIEHACDLSCACTTCHVLVREGFDSLEEATEDEEDLLDKAWGVEVQSRLGCQVVIGDQDLVIELPKYSINQVSEQH